VAGVGLAVSVTKALWVLALRAAWAARSRVP